MNTSELHKKLIEKIKKTKNNGFLEEVYRILESGFGDSETYTFSEEQELAVSEAREQIKKGEVLTEDQANVEIDQWLKK
jgi:hypothetical protein